MSHIQLGRELLASRGNDVRRMLSQIALVPGGPAWTNKIMPGGELVLGVHDEARPEGPIRQWRFSTTTYRIRANYYESWLPLPGQTNISYLERAYLTLYKVQGPAEETELLALHCDPEEPDSETAVYKRGPHFHVTAAQDPIPRAHIALSLGHINEVLESADSLTQSLQESIGMIRDEVLARIEQHE